MANKDGIKCPHGWIDIYAQLHASKNEQTQTMKLISRILNNNWTHIMDEPAFSVCLHHAGTTKEAVDMFLKLWNKLEMKGGVKLNEVVLSTFVDKLSKLGRRNARRKMRARGGERACWGWAGGRVLTGAQGED